LTIERGNRLVRRCLIVSLPLVLWSVATAQAEDARFPGVWKAVTYEIAGVPHTMQGLFIFSKGYYSANVRFQLASGPIEDSNGNSGPYTAENGRIVFKQWVQVHVRPEDKKEPVLSHQGADEASEYRFEGNRLILIFPSKNRYVLERLSE
jgi:hypothetical protein